VRRKNPKSKEFIGLAGTPEGKPEAADIWGASTAAKWEETDTAVDEKNHGGRYGCLTWNRQYLVLNNEAEIRHWYDKHFEGRKTLRKGVRW
jgi:hypothetical protein